MLLAGVGKGGGKRPQELAVSLVNVPSPSKEEAKSKFKMNEPFEFPSNFSLYHKKGHLVSENQDWPLSHAPGRGVRTTHYPQGKHAVLLVGTCGQRGDCEPGRQRERNAVDSFSLQSAKFRKRLQLARLCPGALMYPW